MRAIDELATVITLACETEDRSAGEQRALLNVALRVDAVRSKHTVTNPEPIAPHLTDVVIDSYQPTDRARVEPTKAQRDRLAAMRRAYDLAERPDRGVGAR